MSIVTSWFNRAHQQQAEASREPWQAYLDLLARSIDAPDDIDPEEAADIIREVSKFLPPGSTEEVFARHQQALRRQRGGVADKQKAAAYKLELPRVEAERAKIQQQFDKVAAPLLAKLKHLDAQLAEVGRAGELEIIARNSLLQAWEDLADPADRAREIELNQQRARLHDRTVIEREKLSLARSGTPANALSVARNQLEQKQLHPADRKRLTAQVEQLEDTIENVQAYIAKLEHESRKLSQELDKIRERKLNP